MDLGWRQESVHENDLNEYKSDFLLVLSLPKPTQGSHVHHQAGSVVAPLRENPVPRGPGISSRRTGRRASSGATSRARPSRRSGHSGRSTNTTATAMATAGPAVIGARAGNSGAVTPTGTVMRRGPFGSEA